MIQDTIKRMSNNSFMLKGWTVTLVVALIALLAKEKSLKLLFLPFIPIIMFWALDGFYMRQEILFRKLFDDVRVREDETIDFSMDTSTFLTVVDSWIKVCFSVTLRTFYVGIAITVFIIIFLAA
jgi:hypothetical protein